MGETARRSCSERDSYRAPRDPACDRIQDWCRTSTPLRCVFRRCDLGFIEAVRPNFVGAPWTTGGAANPNRGDVGHAPLARKRKVWPRGPIVDQKYSVAATSVGRDFTDRLSRKCRDADITHMCRCAPRVDFPSQFLGAACPHREATGFDHVRIVIHAAHEYPGQSARG